MYPFWGFYRKVLLNGTWCKPHLPFGFLLKSPFRHLTLLTVGRNPFPHLTRHLNLIKLTDSVPLQREGF